MCTDAELLHRFVADHSETAFTELVHRHLGLVRATALRRVSGDVHAADDVTQQVFVSLARKASSLCGHATLAGWLYVSTHHATAELMRREQRRKQREAVAHSMHLTNSSAGYPDEAARLRPLLDDALISLKPDEREAIVLRFFSGRTFSEIGKAVQLSEEAARKRVDRALEKLHTVLVRRGVTSTVAALGTALTAAGVDSAPMGLALKVAGVALTQAGAPVAVTSLASVFWPAAAAAVLVAGTLAIVSQHRANTATAAVIVSRETATRAAVVALEAENRKLVHDLADAVDRKTDVSPLAVRPTSVGKPVTVTVFVSTEGMLRWEKDLVTLDEFIKRLRIYQAATSESRLIVQANGVRPTQLNWVLDEARKAGIKNIVVESDGTPRPTAG